MQSASRAITSSKPRLVASTALCSARTSPASLMQAHLRQVHREFLVARLLPCSALRHRRLGGRRQAAQHARSAVGRLEPGGDGVLQIRQRAAVDRVTMRALRHAQPRAFPQLALVAVREEGGVRLAGIGFDEQQLLVGCAVRHQQQDAVGFQHTGEVIEVGAGAETVVSVIRPHLAVAAWDNQQFSRETLRQPSAAFPEGCGIAHHAGEPAGLWPPAAQHELQQVRRHVGIVGIPRGGLAGIECAHGICLSDRHDRVGPRLHIDYTARPPARAMRLDPGHQRGVAR